MAKEDRHPGITNHLRERGQTLHLVEALENGEITPGEFATIRAEIVGRPDVLRFVKSVISRAIRRRLSADRSDKKDTPNDDT